MSAEPRRNQHTIHDPHAHWKPSDYARQVLAQIGWDVDEKVPARPRCSQRDASVLEMIICEDVTLDETGQHFNLTRERIRQILKLHTGMSTRDLATYRAPMREILRQVEGTRLLHAALDADSKASMGDLVRASGLHRAEVEQILGPEESLRRGRKNTWTEPTVTDDQVLAEIARVAALPGGSPLGGPFYDKHRGERSISRVRILQRFGTWRDACQLAGVETFAPVRSSYDRKWTNQQLLDWATKYIASAGVRATYGGMTDWLRDRADEGAPSAQTIRNEIGRWRDILELALERIREQDGGYNVEL